MTLVIVLFSILLLVLLITWAKFNPFLAFLIVSIVAGLLLGIPLNTITKSVEKGIGATLGALIIIISLGAMLGKLVAESGAAQRISQSLMKAFGMKYITWALMITGFIVGIPLFYNVGFVLMVPLIFFGGISNKVTRRIRRRSDARILVGDSRLPATASLPRSSGSTVQC